MFKSKNYSIKMLKILASCSVAGEKFSPTAFTKISSVKLVRTNEPGDIGNKGRYRRKPKPYGSASIEISNKTKGWSHLLTVMESCIDALRETGAEDITLSIGLFYDGQCNFELSKKDLKRIAALNIEMSISCYSNELK
jgi:hypothetical protein